MKEKKGNKKKKNNNKKKKKKKKKNSSWTRLPPRQWKMCLTAKDNITDIPLQIIGKIKFEEKSAFFYSILKPNIVVEVIICLDSEF